MFIKFEWPVKIIIFCNEEGEMQPEINFKFKNFKCKVHFNSVSSLDKPYVEIKNEKDLKSYKYFNMIGTITFEVSDDNTNTLKNLIKNKKIIIRANNFNFEQSIKVFKNFWMGSYCS